MTREVSHSSNQQLIALNAKTAEKSYWMSKLSKIDGATMFPSSVGQGNNSGTQGRYMLQFDIDQVITQKLFDVCSNENALLVFLIAALKVQLFKYLNETNITVGTSIIKDSKQKDRLNNILPINVSMDGNLSFRNVLNITKDEFIASQNNEDYPVQLLFDKITGINGSKLFNVAVILDNLQDTSCFSGHEPKLLLRFDKKDNMLKCVVDYCAGSFLQEDVESLINNYQYLLLRCLNEPDKYIEDIEAVSEKEKLQILKINDTQREFDRNSSIHQEFEKQVKFNPDKIALVYHDLKLSYRELNDKANALAHILKKSVSANINVAIFQDMSADYIISVLAILKAGGVYVPIAPSYPKQRIKYLLDDIKTKLIVTTRKTIKESNIDPKFLKSGEDKKGRKIVFTDEINTDQPLLEETVPFDLAYILYTSGSTGKPKGVLISHRNVLRLVKNTEYVKFSEDTSILLTGSPTFDATTFEIWGSLLNGGRLTLVDKDILIDAEKLGKEIVENKINTLWLTSPLFNKLVDQGMLDMFSGLKYLLVGGDALSASHINKLRNRNKNLKIINGYGPTENTTFSLTKEVDKEYELSIPIGRPIQNSTAYILGKNLELKPVLGIGILYVGGCGVTRGYLNNEELTKQKLIKNPYGEGYLYKTDDVVYLRGDFDVEFIGRADNQVKIRGYRIELGEIENQLKELPGVNNSLVITRKNAGGEKYLLGFYTGTTKENEASIKARLKSELPDYMVPRNLIHIDEFPLNTHGKIDIDSLPVVGQMVCIEDEILSDIEKQVVSIWSKLLEIDEKFISRYSNFFELGGHSIHAISLLSIIKKTFGIKVSIPQMFSIPTLAELATFIGDMNSTEAIYSDIPIASQKEFYPISSAQRRMYILQQLNPQSVAYNIFNIVTLKKGADINKINEIFTKLIHRHESLRTVFVKYGGDICQRIESEVEFKVDFIDDDSLTLKDIVETFIQPFDLSKALLVRAAVVNIKSTSMLLIDMHHIISDGISQDILSSEFETLEAGLPLDDLKLHYKDVAEYQNSEGFLNSLKQEEEYWLKEFKEETTVLNLPYDFERPKNRSFEGEEFKLNIDNQTIKDIKRFCKDNEVTLHAFLLSVWTLVVSKYSTQEDIIVGMPIAGRKHHEMQSIVGMFVNTLAIRSYPTSSKTFLEYLSEVKQKVLEAFEHQDYQFEDLIDKLQLSRDMSRNPLFDVSFNLLRSKLQDSKSYDREVSTRDILPKIAKFDLTLSAIDFDNSLRLSLEYATGLFKVETIERMADSYIKALKFIIDNPESVIENVDILSTKEQELLLTTFNDNSLAILYSKGIHQILEETISSTPNALALIDKSGSMTYKVLGQLSDNLAIRLKDKGIQPGEVVGISTGNIKEMAVAMLGILKVGGVFLPFDPLLPKNRIAQMLEISKANLIVTERFLEKELKSLTDLIYVEDLIEDIPIPRISNLSNVSGEDPAYIIFTSGTTGIPNGVKVSHKALINLCAWHVDYYAVSETDRATKYASLSFDASVWEIFPYLYKGASVYFLENDIKLEIKELNAEMEKQAVTITFLPTQIGEKFCGLNNKSLKKLLLGGDKLKKIILGKCTYEVYNNYGPTENTVVTTACRIDTELSNYPIGRPVANTKIYVLKPGGMALVPLNVTGELCISGDSLATGYLNAELTKNSFVNNPFGSEDKLYKTGDLVKWLPDGNLEFIGRINDQIKIRGNRVELTEIEIQIVAVEGVDEAVILHYNPGDSSFLCAYYTSSINVSPEVIKRYLYERLPEYMVPLHLVKLEKLPITNNGKIDKHLLPAPEISSNTTYEAPENDLQMKLINIWSTILDRNKDKIGINDNFFELGGNSLKIILLKDKIFELLKLDVAVVNLFEFSTIKALNEHLERGELHKEEERVKLEIKEEESLNMLNETLQALNQQV